MFTSAGVGATYTAWDVTNFAIGVISRIIQPTWVS